jgi:hypothetical protein
MVYSEYASLVEWEVEWIPIASTKSDKQSLTICMCNNMFRNNYIGVLERVAAPTTHECAWCPPGLYNISAHQVF